MARIECIRRSASDGPETLTARECDIAALVATGLTDAEIADRLGLPEATISAHVEAVMRTLAVRSRLRLAVWAARQESEDTRRRAT
jgi:non-specific serine/threonine protein kinase